ncbi:MAG: hypothetical protein RLY47_179 [Candidatus Parcubacteria bacterium]|jgi:hypothetical protein
MAQEEAVETARRILDEATGMFPNDPGGIGFWRYVHDVAEAEGLEFRETHLELAGPTHIICWVDGVITMFNWTPPD